MRRAFSMFAVSATALAAGCMQAEDCARAPLRRDVSPDGVWVASQTKIVCSDVGRNGSSIEIDVRQLNPAQGDIGNIVHFEGTLPVEIEWAGDIVTLIAPSEGRFSSEEGVRAALTVPKPPLQGEDIRSRR